MTTVPADRSAAEDEHPDGRTRRSIRTRAAIVDATISLVEQGDLRPTAPRVAEAASVSVRSVFQHFDDLENLFHSVAERLVERVAELIVPVDPTLPLPERVERFVHQRALLLEAVTPVRRAAEVHGPFSSEIRARLRDGQAFLREEAKHVFAPELGAVPKGLERTQALDGIDAACSWATWEGLRSGLGRNHAAAEAVVAKMLLRLLAPPSA